MKKGAIIAALASLWVWGAPAMAAVSPAGFTVAPIFQQLDLKQGQAQSEYSVQLRNNTEEDQSFRLSVVDFGSLDEEGGVAFLGAPTSELEHKYGLASWMTLDKDTVAVPAGKSVTINVNVENRSSLAPGGHYAAVLATALTDGGESGAATHVGLKQVLSSLVLATKEGGLKSDLQLVSQSSDAAFWRLPTTVVQRFHNDGNVHLIPRGVVAVQDPAGRVVARTAVNEGSGAVLPDTFRKFHANLDVLGAAWMPGMYKLVSTYRYDGTDQTKTLSTSIWYVGALLTWVVVLAVLAAAGGLAWWLWIRPRRNSHNPAERRRSAA